MKPELEQELQHCRSLPTPPAIALEILELGKRADVDAGDLARVIQRDPALTMRVLRVANSPLYARQRQSETISQAIMVLGLNVTMTLALSFSLARLLQQTNGQPADWMWRRALVAGTAARSLGERCSCGDLEELFLGALLQDIGILALHAQFPDTYGLLLADAKGHDELLAMEWRELGCDHGTVGGWLMRQWGLPAHLSETAEASHSVSFDDQPTPRRLYLQCVAMAGRIADLLIDRQRLSDTESLFLTAEDWFGLDHEAMQTLLENLAKDLEQISRVFDAQLLNERHYEQVMSHARELQLLRNLQLVQEVSEYRRRSQELEQTSRRWREEATRDELTGLHNRRFFNDCLASEFDIASRTGRPLVLAFIDLDHFKQVNDEHGHSLGDEILRQIGRILRSSTRDNDATIRYGGEEFVVLLPATNLLQACAIIDRLRTGIGELAVESPVHGKPVRVTASIGLAVHMDGHYRSERPADLIETADRALYRAKRDGRDRVEIAQDEDY